MSGWSLKRKIMREFAAMELWKIKRCFKKQKEILETKGFVLKIGWNLLITSDLCVYSFYEICFKNNWVENWNYLIMTFCSPNKDVFTSEVQWSNFNLTIIMIWHHILVQDIWIKHLSWINSSTFLEDRMLCHIFFLPCVQVHHHHHHHPLRLKAKLKQKDDGKWRGDWMQSLIWNCVLLLVIQSDEEAESCRGNTCRSFPTARNQ